MKERSIIFPGPNADAMIQAVLKDRKTRHSWPIKPQPGSQFYEPPAKSLDTYAKRWGLVPNSDVVKHPYSVGQRLWVREAWNVMLPAPFSDYPEAQRRECTIYRATHLRPEECRWRSSTHMPRWASRITLEVTGVGVQRVQEMHHDAEQFKAEGITLAPTELYPQLNTADKLERVFRRLWDATYAKRGLGWDANPWCWWTTFKRIEP